MPLPARHARRTHPVVFWGFALPGLAARGGGRLLTACVVLTALLLLFFGVGPRTGEYRTFTMLTGSMEPRYPTGSVLIDRPVPLHELAVGDVLTYQIPVLDRSVVSHRVVEIEPALEGGLLVKTKGDNNNGIDPWRARITDDEVWVVKAAVPHAGAALRVVRQPHVRTAMLYVLPSVLLIWLLSAIWRPSR